MYLLLGQRCHIGTLIAVVQFRLHAFLILVGDYGASIPINTVGAVILGG